MTLDPLVISWFLSLVRFWQCFNGREKQNVNLKIYTNTIFLLPLTWFNKSALLSIHLWLHPAPDVSVNSCGTTCFLLNVFGFEYLNLVSRTSITRITSCSLWIPADAINREGKKNWMLHTHKRCFRRAQVLKVLSMSENIFNVRWTLKKKQQQHVQRLLLPS